MLWCGMELQKQEQAFISNASCRRDYGLTEDGINSVPVCSGERGVASVSARPSKDVSVSSREGDVFSVSRQSSRNVTSPDPVIPSHYRS